MKTDFYGWDFNAAVLRKRGCNKKTDAGKDSLHPFI